MLETRGTNNERTEMKRDAEQFIGIPDGRTQEQDDRGMCAVGILIAAAVCSIFWFAVGFLVGRI